MFPLRNLIIILTHGLRSDALSDDRSWPLQTPCFERLAQRGLRLAASSASPTDDGGATSLLTGLHARQHGILGGDGAEPPALAQALPRWLSEAGYHIAGVGCVGPVRRWLDEAVHVAPPSEIEPRDCAYWAQMTRKGFAGMLSEQRAARARAGPFEPTRMLLEPEDDIDGFIGREAGLLMGRLPTDRPWVLLVMFSGPGNDMPPPTLYESVVRPGVLRDGFVPADLRTVDALAEPAYPRAMLQRLEPQTIGRIRADYLGRVSLIDFSVGRLLHAAAERGDRDRTWTVLASDRGHLLGEHGLVGPHSFLAGALEVPVLVSPPPTAQVRERPIMEGLVSSVDVAATIAALGGCDVPWPLAGHSLLPMLAAAKGEAADHPEGEPADEQADTQAHANEAMRQAGAAQAALDDPSLPEPASGNLSEFGDRLMLETERFKAIYDRTTRRCLGLFDLLHDPDERTDLLSTSRGRNLVDALRWRMADALMPLCMIRGVIDDE